MSSQQEKEVIEQMKSDYLNSFQNWLNNMGMDPNIGRVMQILRFSDLPMTQNQIKDSSPIKISTPTISRNLKIMQEFNLLKIESNPKKGKKSYEYSLKEHSLYYLFSNYLTNALNLLNRRLDDYKIFMSKINQLPMKLQNDKDIQKLKKFIEEEDDFFKVMISKFAVLMKDFEEVTIKL